ncbi:MAG: YIP1 family protein [Candidatus Diapherotrites archaeon]|uniref:YIP1 family protein n=1 Tax=Candidatus Iainarchaeum sp. TaxID=3101447 RepID=A0A8T4CAA1_9ARCH|nr:YIP1 family protein [Candidatus Diapherotrites archaeon]
MEFFEILIHPKERMEQELRNVDVNWAHKRFAIYGAVIGLLFGLMFAVLGGIIGVAAGGATQNSDVFGLIAGLGFLAIIIMPILMALLTVISSYIFYHIVAFIAKLLGGNGSFDANYFLAAKLLLPLIVVNIIMFIVTMIPYIGGIINLVWFLYTVYLMVVLVSVANALSLGKAIVVWVILMIVGFILGLFMAGAMLASLIGAVGAGTTTLN